MTFHAPFPFSIIPFLVIGVFVIVIGGILFNIGKGLTEWTSNNSQPDRRDAARVVSKRSEVSGGRDSTATTYYATFELPAGERTELEVSGREYGQLSEGDTGTLSHQGTRYLGFARSRQPEPPVIETPPPRNLVCAYCGNALPAGEVKCAGCGWTWKPAPASTES